MKTQLYLVLIFFFVLGCKENTENSNSLAKEMELKNKENKTKKQIIISY